MEDNFSTNGVGGMVSGYTYCDFISIITTSTPFQIIGHEIWKVGDSCFRGVK